MSGFECLALLLSVPSGRQNSPVSSLSYHDRYDGVAISHEEQPRQIWIIFTPTASKNFILDSKGDLKEVESLDRDLRGNDQLRMDNSYQSTYP